MLSHWSNTVITIENDNRGRQRAKPGLNCTVFHNLFLITIFHAIFLNYHKLYLLHDENKISSNFLSSFEVEPDAISTNFGAKRPITRQLFQD